MGERKKEIFSIKIIYCGICNCSEQKQSIEKLK